MNLATQRRVRVIALMVGIFLLSGCASPTLASTQESSAPAPITLPHRASPAPTPSSTPNAEAASGEPLELAFGSAEELVDPQWGFEWTDPFITDDGFAVLGPDNGQGSWSYTDLATKCELHFYQGEVFDLDWSQDDRAVSDQMLAILATGTPTPEDSANVSANAGDIRIALEPDGGAVELRVIGGGFPDGGSVVHATRMLGAVGGGLTVSLVCPAGRDASSEFSRLAESSLSVLVTK